MRQWGKMRVRLAIMIARENHYRWAPEPCFRNCNVRNPSATAQIDDHPGPKFRERALSTWGRLVRT